MTISSSVDDQGTVFLYEEIEYTDDVRVSYLTGRFTGSQQRDGVVERSPEHMTPEDAIAWGRARSHRVLIRVRGPQHYSAGAEPLVGDNVMPWPDEGIPLPAQWQRIVGMDWLDRTQADDPILWDVQVSGLGWPIAITPAVNPVIFETAAREPDIEVLGMPLGGASPGELRIQVEARTESDAWELATQRIRPLVTAALESLDNGPAQWIFNLWAVPSGVNASAFPRHDGSSSVVRK